MPTGLFSTYRQGENRVTSTLLAVLERLSLWNMDRLLRDGLLGDGDDAYRLITFKNQLKKTSRGQESYTVPDAEIFPGQQILIETKIAAGAAGQKQVEGHLAHLQSDGRLVLLTPDDGPPVWLREIHDSRSGVVKLP